MSTLTIDPGTKSIGWALFDDKHLVRCGLVQRFELHRLENKLPRAKAVVVEKPQVYNVKLWKGDPNDLIDVAAVAGACAAISKADRLKFVKPHDWKGSVPKQIMLERILEAMTAEEEKILDATGVGKTLLHNVIDAIGIGLKEVGRL